MEHYDPAMTFGPRAAEVYDAVSQRGDESETVEFLAGLAGSGPVLELAIGTGRIALPLAARGIRVDGVDFSDAMVAQLRAKPGGAALDVRIGDFAAVDVDGEYGLIYLVFNTLFNLLTQDGQVRCFENVARHLAPGGSFVVEAFTPAYLYRLRDDQYVDAESIRVDEVRLDVARHDAVNQTLVESHITVTESGVRLNPIVSRYAWPSELDLMARIAGLKLKARWGGWKHESFTSSSLRHVSVWGRSEAEPSSARRQ